MKDDPGTFRDLQSIIYANPGQARTFALTAHRNGLIRDETLEQALSRVQGRIDHYRSEARQEGPKSAYERNREYIVRSMDPGPLVQDPLPRSRLAEALATFDAWMLSGKRDDKDIDARAREVVGQYKMVDFNGTVLALPSPRSGQIRRNPGDRAGMQQDLAAAAAEAKRRLDTKQITRSEYEDEL